MLDTLPLDYVRCTQTENSVPTISLADYPDGTFIQSPIGYSDACVWNFEASTSSSVIQLEVVYLQVN